MTDWYLNRALTNFRRETDARWPNRDRSSDGTIGDYKHSQTNSEHNPDPDGSVDAWDTDVDGIDVEEFLQAAISHEATWYVIYNEMITSRTMKGGLGYWHPYYGDNPHDKHIHTCTREEFENSNKPWYRRPLEVFEMFMLKKTGDAKVWISDGLRRRHVPDRATRDFYLSRGVELITVGSDTELKSKGGPVDSEV